ncbi:MAG: 50S ribosomal protein L23 [Chloroflexota bacterium]|nr:50S ribosomal protein L23 [Chloroflexota bacterium]
MSKHHKYAILKRPLITEKTTLMQEDGRYVFEVAKNATKLEVKEAVQEAFGVTVTKVNTMNVKGKMKRFGPRFSQKRSWKQAVVSVAQADSITLFEGV